MRTLGLATMFALASTAACADSVFEIPVEGAKARIHFNENCKEDLCASVSWTQDGKRRVFKLPGISSKTLTNMFGSSFLSDADDADDAEGDMVPEPKRKLAAVVPAVPITTGSRTAPAEQKVAAAVPAHIAPQVKSTARTKPKVMAVASDPAPAPIKKPTKPSPIGEWRVQKGEGRVRIEPCGANLCGYVSAAKNPKDRDRNNPNPKLRNRSVIGMPVLINMKPSGKRWKGRIYNAKDGRTYKSTIALKGADRLQVRGCAFGGLVCGGQTWSRVN